MSRRVDSSHTPASTTAAATPAAQASTWLARWPLVAAVALLIGVPWLFVTRGEQSEWNDCFVTAAKHLAPASRSTAGAKPTPIRRAWHC